MASGWNLSMSVVRMYRCGYNNFIFTYSTCISSFLAAASLFLCSFLKCFFPLFNYNTMHATDKITSKTNYN